MVVVEISIPHELQEALLNLLVRWSREVEVVRQPCG